MRVCKCGDANVRHNDFGTGPCTVCDCARFVDEGDPRPLEHRRIVENPRSPYKQSTSQEELP